MGERGLRVRFDVPTIGTALGSAIMFGSRQLTWLGLTLIGIGLILPFNIYLQGKVEPLIRRMIVFWSVLITLLTVFSNLPVEHWIELVDRYPYEIGVPGCDGCHVVLRGKTATKAFQTEPYRFSPGIHHRRSGLVLEKVRIFVVLPKGIEGIFDPAKGVWTLNNRGLSNKEYYAQLSDRVSRRHGRTVDESLMLKVTAPDDYIIRYHVDGVIAGTNESFETGEETFTLRIR